MKNRPASSRPRPSRAVDEVVAAAQDPDAAVVRRVGEPDVRGHRDPRLAVGPGGREVGLVELVGRPSGAPVPLSRPMICSCSASGRAVPGLDVHPDLPGDQVGAAGHPGRRRRPSDGATHTCSSSAAPSSGLMLAVPSLKPNRLRGVDLAARRRRGAPEARAGPPHGDDAEADPDQVAHRVHGDLRVVGAGLDAEVAAAAAPGRGRRRGSAGRSRSAAGRRSARPNRSSNSVGPKPDGQGEVARREVERLAGVVRRRLRGPPPTAPPGRPRRRPSSARRRAVQPVSSRRSSAAVVGDDVERDEVQPVLRRRDDAGLVRTRRTATTPSSRGRRQPSAGTRLVRRAATAYADRRRPRRRAAPGAAGEDRPAGGPRSSLGDDAGDLADRLGERVERVGELLELGLA